MEIIGGYEVKPHCRPYMALLNTSNSMCGGTLIKANWILTAAHCCMTDKTIVVLGAHNRLKREKEQRKFRILRAVRHPEYNFETNNNDIQLVQLYGTAKLNRNIKTLSIENTENDLKNGTICTTAGWGVTEEGSKKSSDVLREAILQIVDRNKCKAVYQKIGAEITTDMLCAQGAKSNDDSCQGDSGGPLICDGKLRGIVSFGIGCGRPGIPGVYTRLTNYINWINYIINRAD
ncbi:granzyme A-like isoform X2 [Pelobates fuscus]